MSTPAPDTNTKETDHRSRSFWTSAKFRFKKNRLAWFSFWYIVTMSMVALFSDFLAYNKPIYASYQGNSYFPIFNDYLSAIGLYQWDTEFIHADWRSLELESSIWPPVRYLPSDIDFRNSQFVGPFDEQDIRSSGERHYLGTDGLGRDVMSGLLHGSRISLTVGMVSVGISAFIGIIMGSFAGFYGDDRLRMSRIRFLFVIIGLFLGYFYGFHIRADLLGDALSNSFVMFIIHAILSFLIFVGTIGLMYVAAIPFQRIPFLGKELTVWVDITISRIIEIIVSIPSLLLIITIAAIAKPSLYLVMAIIGFTSWTGIARFTRGEMLKVKNMDYIQAAKALGYSQIRVIFVHALPNALSPVFVSIAFGIAAAILIESSLSFLGIGVPASTVTWGSLLSEARSSASAWWLAIFPGAAIFITVTVFNLVGEGLRDALDPRLKR